MYIDDSHLRDPDSVYDEMLDMRDRILESLSKIERCALFMDFPEFRELYEQERFEVYDE